jgi:hypothetical protein
MSTASRSGSGEETTSANVVRNPPASVSGSCIVRSSGTNRIGRRIATGSSDRNLPRAASRLYCRQCDNGEFVQGRVADFSRRRDSNGCQARTGRMQRGRRTATIGSVPLSPWSACYQVVSGSPASFVSASGIEKGALVSAVETDEIERGNAVVIASDRLAIDDAGARTQASQRLDDQREAVREIIAGTAVEPHLGTVLAGNNPKTIVLDLVQPLAARRQFIGLRRGRAR